MNLSRVAILIIAASGALAGCASEPTFGERLLAEGETRAALGERAVAAERDIRKGEDLIRRGRDKIQDGEADIERGQSLRGSGTQELDEIRQATMGR